MRQPISDIFGYAQRHGLVITRGAYFGDKKKNTISYLIHIRTLLLMYLHLRLKLGMGIFTGLPVNLPVKLIYRFTGKNLLYRSKYLYIKCASNELYSLRSIKNVLVSCIVSNLQLNINFLLSCNLLTDTLKERIYASQPFQPHIFKKLHFTAFYW